MELTIAGPARHAWRDGDVVTTGAFVQEFRYPTQPNRPSEDEDLDLRVPGVTRSRTFALMPPGAVDGVNHRWASTACLARRGRRYDRGLRSRISISDPTKPTFRRPRRSGTGDRRPRLPLVVYRVPWKVRNQRGDTPRHARGDGDDFSFGAFGQDFRLPTVPAGRRRCRSTATAGDTHLSARQLPSRRRL